MASLQSPGAGVNSFFLETDQRPLLKSIPASTIPAARRVARAIRNLWFTNSRDIREGSQPIFIPINK